MRQETIIKRANTKGRLAKAVLFYQRALSHYANENNWVVKGDDIVWVGDDDPTYAAQVSLGKRKDDPEYFKRNAAILSGNRTERPSNESVSNTGSPNPGS